MRTVVSFFDKESVLILLLRHCLFNSFGEEIYVYCVQQHAIIIFVNSSRCTRVLRSPDFPTIDSPISRSALRFLENVSRFCLFGVALKSSARRGSFRGKRERRKSRASHGVVLPFEGPLFTSTDDWSIEFAVASVRARRRFEIQEIIGLEERTENQSLTLIIIAPPFFDALAGKG